MTATDTKIGIKTLLSSPSTILGGSTFACAFIHMAGPAWQGQAQQETDVALSTSVWISVTHINFACFPKKIYLYGIIQAMVVVDDRFLNMYMCIYFCSHFNITEFRTDYTLTAS